MQLKLKINDEEELTLTSFNEENVDDLKDLISLFGELIPNIKIYAGMLDHSNMKSQLVYKQRRITDG
jgi:hypothetical protein